VIFIPNAKQGEHVKVKVTRISRRFAEAEVVREEQPQGGEEKAE
jgi:predicted RNA-binding protein with TRAM domain